MIQPANIKYQGVTGGTFDTVITLFNGSSSYVWYGVWQPFRTYPINALVAGTDSKIYVSTVSIDQNDNPVIDHTNWSLVPPLDITSWTGTCTIGVLPGPVATVACVMGGVEGTVGVNFAGVATAAFPATIPAVAPSTVRTQVVYPLTIEVFDGADNYFPVIGSISFLSGV